MKGKVVLSSLLAVLFSTSLAFAAPLTDFSAGKTAVEVGVIRSDVKISGGAADTKFGSKYNMNWGVTTGLGSNFALQYKGFTSKGKSTYLSDFNLDGTARLNHHELNVLYELSKQENSFLYAFVGMTRDKGKVKVDGVGYSSKSKNNWQVGLGGVANIARDFDAFASVGAGNRVLNWKVGISYAINQDFDVEFFYSYYKAKKLSGIDLDAIGGRVDGSSKGFGIGVTYKF